MSWEKHVVATEKRQNLFLFLIIFFILISYLAHKPLILLPAGFIAAYLVLNWQYDKWIGRQFNLLNPTQTIRLFEGEDAAIKIKIKNSSVIPYFNGQLSFKTNQKIAGDKALSTSIMQKNLYQIPVALLGKHEGILSIPVKGIERGISRLTEIRFIFPHLFNFENVELAYTDLFKTEIIIYPKPITVSGITSFPYHKFGNQVSRFSPFEDKSNLVGTKDYVWSDSFRQIHWKASVKNQKLQSKVFEHNHLVSWTIIVNIAKKSPLGNLYYSEHLEKYLSYVTYMAQHIIKQGIPLTIYLNMTNIGGQPYFIEQGQGTEHLKRILEFLARTETNGKIMKMEDLLHRIDLKKTDGNLVALIGDIDLECHHFITKWANEGKTIFTIQDDAESGYLKEISSERFIDYDSN